MDSVKQLRLFVTTYRLGSLSTTADLLSMAQPNASRLLRGFEQQIGTRLFDRSTSGMTPTPDAHKLLPFAEAALETFDRLQTEASKLRQGDDSNLVRVLTFPRCANALVIPAIGKLRESDPSLDVHVETKPRREIPDGFASSSEYDIVVTTKRTPSTSSGVVGQVPLVVVVAKAHGLAGMQSLTLRHLDGEDMIELEEGTLMRSVAHELLATQGITPVVRARATNAQHAIEMAAAGMGFFIVDALVPKHILEGTSDAVAIRLDAPPAIDVIAAHNGKQARTLSELKSLLADHVQDMTSHFS